jgi:dienelactone hydrolase
MRSSTRRPMNGYWNLLIGAAFGLMVALTGNPAIAAEQSETSPEGAGLQAASWLATIPYGAVKVAYALGGSIVGGLTWAMSGGDTAAAKAVWIPSMTGDYIVQPQNLTGERPIHFLGGSSEKSNS